MVSEKEKENGAEANRGSIAAYESVRKKAASNQLALTQKKRNT